MRSLARACSQHVSVRAAWPIAVDVARTQNWLTGAEAQITCGMTWVEDIPVLDADGRTNGTLATYIISYVLLVNWGILQVLRTGSVCVNFISKIAWCVTRMRERRAHWRESAGDGGNLARELCDGVESDGAGGRASDPGAHTLVASDAGVCA